MAKKNAQRRSILLPALDDEFAEAGKLAFWKRILPEGRSIDYTDKDGTSRRIDFTARSNQKLLDAFDGGEMDQTPFMLADADNRHTMHPEQYRGEVTAMRMGENGEEPGLYARIEFPDKRSAKAVRRNPKLGVSARIREGVGATGTKIIHVLGTLDPKVRGLGAWTPALDFAEYAHDELIDLTQSSYSEAPVSKKTKSKTLDLSAVPDIADVTVEDIEKMTDEQVAAFMAVYGPGGTHPVLDDDDDDDSDDDKKDDEGVKLSNAKHRRDVDLANAAAEDARRDGREALKRAAAIEWKATRKDYVRDGVPAFVLDLAEPVLSRPYDLVVDLSNTDDEDLDVADVVRRLVDGYKGTVDLSEREIGHGGDEGGEDPDADVKARFKRDFPDA